MNLDIQDQGVPVLRTSHCTQGVMTNGVQTEGVLTFKILRFPPPGIENRGDSNKTGENEGGDFDRNFHLSLTGREEQTQVIH